VGPLFKVDTSERFKLSWFAWTSLMAYNKSQLTENSDEASSCYRLNLTVHISDKYVPIWPLLQVAFEHTSIDLNSFMGIQN
jgi:hypothetical protein